MKLQVMDIIIFIMQASATALMMAIYHGLSGVVEALLRAKPDVNITATGVCLHHLSILDLQYLIFDLIPIYMSMCPL